MSQFNLNDILVGLSDDELEMVENMKKYGGSFVLALASLILAADGMNYKKILKTWPEIINEYHPYYQPKKLTK